ncbi:Uncharacterized protein TCM_004038 [Theobroma cacao]|uniref:Uncharacterized protein n=1 Tax=Theobroma cacao TaxID=3641 RepID=A0A061DNR1_THECC|nr:Uncharacterized protein TCM_004038 [Theobroma cacao]
MSTGGSGTSIEYKCASSVNPPIEVPIALLRFLSSIGVTTTITTILKSHFSGPPPTRRQVPNDVKELIQRNLCFYVIKKHGECSLPQLDFDLQALSQAFGGVQTTRTHVYEFGARVRAASLLDAVSMGAPTSEFAG